METQKHPSLPKNLTPEETALWLKKSAVEVFIDEKKRYFKENEIAEFEHESSISGRELNRLNDLKKTVNEHITKGNTEELTIIIPKTMGTKLLDTTRRQNDDFVEKGYEVEQIEVFCIPNQVAQTMEFFTIEGDLIADRTRPMSSKEIKVYVGLFAIKNEGTAEAIEEKSENVAV